MANRKVKYKFSRVTLGHRIRDAESDIFGALSALDHLLVGAHTYRLQVTAAVEMFDNRLATRPQTEDALDVGLQGLVATSHDIYDAVDKLRDALDALEATWLDLTRPKTDA